MLKHSSVQICIRIQSNCIRRIHGGLGISARECCSNDTSLCLQVRRNLHFTLMIINTFCVVVCICLIPFAVWMRLKPKELRSWALVEVILLGAAILYSVFDERRTIYYDFLFAFFWFLLEST
ncbi:unnamed protein product [Enterobius vermicularis]|uniref:Uncharacterized protein n=1 Tax=Enterobius vermicularis TaxID=51028 RepID=A0A0N4VQ78_ENTVE|nr:unnamed protein product [Enterobius vermicularis]